MNALILAACLTLVPTADYAPTRAGRGPIADATQEARAHEIGQTIRCAVCQGLSVAASPSPMAQAMMDTVRDLVEKGQSQEQIQAYFVERYGEWILLAPKAQGYNLIVWLAPAALLLVGLWVLRGRVSQETRASSVQTPADSSDVSDADLKKVRQAVDDV